MTPEPFPFEAHGADEMLLTPAPPCTLPPDGWRCLLPGGHGGTSCPTVPDLLPWQQRVVDLAMSEDPIGHREWLHQWDPIDPDDGTDEAIDTAACWLGRAIWAGIVVGGFALGAGLAGVGIAVHRRVTR